MCFCGALRNKRIDTSQRGFAHWCDSCWFKKMFENLTNKLESAFSIIRKAPTIKEADIKSCLKTIRSALLEADVSLKIVKEFILEIEKKVSGKEVIKTTTASQTIIKIVNDELINLLGKKNEKLNLKSNPPISILIVGLQGSGKTTTSAKLAKFIEKNFKKRVMLTSLDIYRPAAQEQLEILAKKISVSSLPIEKDQSVTDICKRSLNLANLNGSDVIIFDTAGRTQIDLKMMTEIKQVKELVNPTETILVADALTGQIAVEVAKEFDRVVNLSSVILTRLDGDGRGGAALSMRQTTGKPIKLVGVGESIDDLENFYPDRIANRILGMGDIVSLVEKASKDLTDEEIKKSEEEIKKGQFTLNNYLQQIRQMKKMGGMEGVLSMLPGVSKIKNKMSEQSIDEKMLVENEAIILSMTNFEKNNPKIINGSRKKRISNGSGVDISKINKLLKQFKMLSDMMRKVSQGKKIPSGVLPDEIFNQLK